MQQINPIKRKPCVVIALANQVNMKENRACLLMKSVNKQVTWKQKYTQKLKV